MGSQNLVFVFGIPLQNWALGSVIPGPLQRLMWGMSSRNLALFFGPSMYKTFFQARTEEFETVNRGERKSQPHKNPPWHPISHCGRDFHSMQHYKCVSDSGGGVTQTLSFWIRGWATWEENLINLYRDGLKSGP